jgi:hypothetical protein
MKFVVEEPAIVNGLTALAGTGGITTLNDEARDKAVEYRAGEIAIEAELQKIPGCERGLFGKQLK